MSIHGDRWSKSPKGGVSYSNGAYAYGYPNTIDHFVVLVVYECVQRGPIGMKGKDCSAVHVILFEDVWGVWTSHVIVTMSLITISWSPL
jgi:hypothetical protein